MAENVTITIEDGDDVTINVAEAQDGAAATIAVGTTTTGNAGTNASVTNSGTTSAAVLNFTIPRGATGANGSNGATGPAGPNSITSATTSDGTADLTIAGLTLDGSATFIGGDIIIESTLDIQTADFTFGSGSAQAFKDALEIVSDDMGDATSDAVLNPQKVLKTNAGGGLTLGQTFIEAASNLTALEVASVDGIGANVYSETGTGGLFGSTSGIGGNLYSDGAGTGAVIGSATGTGADISTDDGTAIIAMSGTGKIISGNNATTEVFAVSNAGVVQASGLNLTGTSYTYGSGAALAHGASMGFYDARIASCFSSPYLSAADHFLGRFAGGNGNGFFNWLTVGSNSTWSDVSFAYSGFLGGTVIYNNNNACFNYIVATPAVSIENYNNVVFDFVFNTYTPITSENIFVGIRSIASSTVETGRKGLWYEAGVDTNWQLLHETSAGVKTKIDTGKAVAASQTVRVTMKFISGTQTDLIIATSTDTTPVSVSATSGFTCTGSLGLGFGLRSTTASNRFLIPMRAVLAWNPPTL